ncbi:hypothetical protein V8E51_006514 [Hyaloscypha variabilis]
MTRTVAFLGASAGVGLSALKHSLAAGNQCIALCRYPPKLTSIFPQNITPNLKIIEGNAKDITSVSKCVRCDGRLVDEIIFTVGGKLNFPKFTLDPEVCRTVISTVLEAITQLRAGGITGRPYIVACSSAGISDFGRDLPLVMIPLYYYVLQAPNEDKKAMEKRLEESTEEYTVVRMSALMGGETKRIIRVGLEDPKKGREEGVIGYTISKEDAGRWIAENLVFERDAKYLRRIATITY